MGILYVYAAGAVSPPRFDNRYMSATMTNMTKNIVMYGGMDDVSSFFLASFDAHALSSFVIPSHERLQSSLNIFPASHLVFGCVQ